VVAGRGEVEQAAAVIGSGTSGRASAALRAQLTTHNNNNNNRTN